ncbi:cytochrome P450 [Diplogelasinospora grovesii]|uniref:Cytochrome P450 n=1 Tax=Diplogelasinospora grovesii TaxID=303347 RepID=A0AAN6S2F1_9PEZI|nr:cytochrome P450 [Diplogelasinospora grovesii]
MGTLQVLTGVVFLAAGYTLCKNIFLLLCNVRLARRSGIQYVLVPVNSYNRWFALLGARLLVLADCFFGAPTSPISWRWLVRGGWPWRIRYAPFEQMGTDTFLTVAPGGCILYTADADVIRQILGRMSDFPKPTFLYRNVDIFGKNVVTTDGAAWRRHRRLVAPALGERNNRLVWEETVRQMQSLMRTWSKTESQAVRTVHKDAMGLSLNVIGKAGFGQEMGLPGHEDQGKGIPGGHTMAFAASLECLLSNILPIVVLPKWFLRRGPSRPLRAAYKSYCEFRQYMCEMLEDKKSAVHSSPEASARSNMDLLGQIVKGQDLHLLEEADKNPEYTGGLTDSEVLGNLFVLLFAGHETTAGTLHSLIIMLAIHPWDQRRLQAALDSILEDSVAKTNWSSDLSSAASCFNYDALLPKLLSSPYVTAVVNETLRLMGPIPTIPKYVPATAEPQRLIVDGVEVSVPPGTRIKLCAACVHRNPKYWPHQTQSYRQSAAPFQDKTRVPGTHWTSWPPANQHNDLEGFRPERWLETIHSSKSNNESWTSVISPPFGAFIPFSEGPRACLGKRFAQVELVAALAVLFSSHSVELAVDELADVNSDALRAMGRDERRQMWECAAEEANGRWRKTMSMVITLQMRGAHVPVRLVRRGSEMFDDL